MHPKQMMPKKDSGLKTPTCKFCASQKMQKLDCFNAAYCETCGRVTSVKLMGEAEQYRMVT